MKFSVCIPNYNYGRYIERTIRSVLNQSYDNFEILVSDNDSTDDSADVIRKIGDQRLRLSVNRCNVGFAANLDRAALGATGDFMLMLSSDDVMRPHALETYARAIKALGSKAASTILCGSCDIIDENDRVTGHLDKPRNAVWSDSDVDAALSSELGLPVYQIEAEQLLRRCLLRMQNPFFFCATAYPRKLYEAIEGYGGNRLIGPDKWFHWRLLGVAATAVFVGRSLFEYRIHSKNQLSQQSQSGAVKYLLDGYMNSFEMGAALLDRAQITRTDFERAFIEYDVIRHGLALLSEGQRTLSRRTLSFGKAAYPQHLRSNWHGWVLRLLLALGSAGSWAARRIRTRFAVAPFEQSVNAK